MKQRKPVRNTHGGANTSHDGEAENTETETAGNMVNEDAGNMENEVAGNMVNEDAGNMENEVVGNSVQTSKLAKKKVTFDFYFVGLLVFFL